MSEEDSSQEKTEEPTARRQEKAREDGQVPRSKDLTTAAVMLAGTVGLALFGGWVAHTLMEVLVFNFQLEREVIYDPQLMIAQLVHSFDKAFFSLAPIFAMLLLAAALSPILLGGWLFSGKSIAPKMNRISPIAGIKRIFSVKSLVELVKSIAKIVVVIAVALFTLKYFEQRILILGQQSLEGAIHNSLQISLWAAIWISSSILLIAAMDVPYQVWENNKKLKMTKQAVKDEYKDSEGKPEVKGRIRQLQREMSNRRMMSEVPKADVIITNPTHFSVALRYDPTGPGTPVVVAKGVDQVAFKIREIAKQHKVEIVRAPVLARAIYHTTGLDQEIPQQLYLAVAQVLAYIFQLRNWRSGMGERPPYPRNLKVPPDMQFPQ